MLPYYVVKINSFLQKKSFFYLLNCRFLSFLEEGIPTSEPKQEDGMTSIFKRYEVPAPTFINRPMIPESIQRANESMHPHRIPPIRALHLSLFCAANPAKKDEEITAKKHSGAMSL